MDRQIRAIAIEIACSGDKIPNAAKPYLDIMGDLEHLGETYISDSATRIVAGFLCNSGQWKGETARRIKKELNNMLNAYYKENKVA